MTRGPVATVVALMCLVLGGCLKPAETPQPAPEPTTTTPTTPRTTAPVTAAPPTAKPAFGFTPTLEPVTGKKGNVSYNVKLPQVTGNNTAARDRFNEGMRTALDDVVRGLNDPKSTKPAPISDGQLFGQENSRVSFIGPHVVAGLAVFSGNGGGPHPNQYAATITTNTDTAHPITFGDVFPDQERARETLRKLAHELVPAGRASTLGDLKGEQFLCWLPAPTGLTFYVVVSHAAGDYVPFTVPWARIRDQVAPAMVPVLSQ